MASDRARLVTPGTGLERLEHLAERIWDGFFLVEYGANFTYVCGTVLRESIVLREKMDAIIEAQEIH